MAHVVSITDGSTTVTFTAANGYMVEEYDLRTPESEGGVIAPDVAETLLIYITGTSGSQVQGRMATLERLLEGVRRRQEWGAGPRVFIQLQIDSDGSAWRSELYDARLEPQEEMLRLWPNNAPTLNLFIRRAPTWEGTLVQLPLTNANGTNNTSGLTIWNHDDSGAGHDNYVQVASGAVAGNLPAPVMVELTNTTGGSVNYLNVWMANNAFSDPTGFPHILEAETGLVSGGSVSGNGDSSNGQYVVQTVNTSAVQQYTLSQTLLQDAAGHDFHILARFRTYGGPIYVKPAIWDASGNYPLWQGDEIQLPVLGDSIADLGVFPLPPGGYSTAWAAQRLYLSWRASGSKTVETDCFAFFPAATFRRLRLGIPLANGGRIVDDQIERRGYTVTSSVESPTVMAAGMPLVVWPNTVQRIYFLWSLANTSAPIDQTFTVKLWYRPRRYSF